jgi:membrane protein
LLGWAAGPIIKEAAGMRVPGLRGLSVGTVARRLLGEISEDDCAGQAAQLAYYFLFALFPLLLFLVTLIGYLPIPDLFDRMMEWASAVLPAAALTLVQDNVRSVTTKQHGGLLSFGALAALWGASAGFRAIMGALNRAYDVEEGRPWWKVYGLSVVATVGFTVVAVAAFLLIILGPQMGEGIAALIGLGDLFHTLWNVLRWPVALVLLALVVGGIYYVAPDVEQDFRWVTPGSALATIGWVVASGLFSLYVQNFGSYDATYGSLGAVIVLLLFLYITGFMLVAGGELNAVVEHLAPEGKREGAKSLADRGPSPAPAGDGARAGVRPATADSASSGRRVADRRRQGPPPAVAPDLESPVAPGGRERRHGERRQAERRGAQLRLVHSGPGSTPPGAGSPALHGVPPARDDSPSGVLSELAEDASRLIRLQARLAALEAKIVGRNVIGGAGLLATGAVVVCVGIIALAGGVVLLLAGALPPWLAALGVAALALVASVVVVRSGLAVLRGRTASAGYEGGTQSARAGEGS